MSSETGDEKRETTARLSAARRTSRCPVDASRRQPKMQWPKTVPSSAIPRGGKNRNHVARSVEGLQTSSGKNRRQRGLELLRDLRKPDRGWVNFVLPVGLVWRQSSLRRHNHELFNIRIRGDSIQHIAEHFEESLHHYKFIVRIRNWNSQMLIRVVQRRLKPRPHDAASLLPVTGGKS
jgi:hypothetical protein